MLGAIEDIAQVGTSAMSLLRVPKPSDLSSSVNVITVCPATDGANCPGVDGTVALKNGFFGK